MEAGAPSVRASLGHRVGVCRGHKPRRVGVAHLEREKLDEAKTRLL